MPALHYHLRWPDGSESRCYSPSLVIKEFLEPGASYDVAEFLRRLRAATRIASDRVAAKYGYACSRAADQLAAIEQRAAGLDSAAHRIQLVRFEEPLP
jgi:uncharacterized repeat protein (TIGR04042 family)